MSYDLRATDMPDLRRIHDSGRWVAYDCETWAITKGVVTPPLVVATICGPDGLPTIMLRDQALDWLGRYLAGDGWLVGHNISFDLAVAVCARPELRIPVFRAYENNRILDTMIIEKMRKIAHGWTKFDPRLNRVPKFDLASLVSEYLGEVLEKKDTYRLRFKELDGMTLEEMPAEAKTYAMDDARSTARVFTRQCQTINTDAAMASTLIDLGRQMRAAWALMLMGAWGFRTDSVAVEMLATRLTHHVNEALTHLIAAGIYRYEGPKKDPKRKRVKTMSVLRERVVEAFARKGETCPMTEGGKGEVKNPQPKTDSETLYNSLDPDLAILADVSNDAKLLNTYIPLLRDAATWALCPSYNVLVDTGRTSCARPNIQNQPRKGGVRECFVPRRGYVYVGCDYQAAELRSLAQVCLTKYGSSEMAKAFEHTEEYPEGKDLHLEMAAAIIGSTYKEAENWTRGGDPQAKKVVKDARQLAKCFHPETEVLTPAGWVPLPALKGDELIATPEVLPSGDVCITWEQPARLTWRPHSGVLVHVRSEGIDLQVTPDHRMIGFTQGPKHSIGKITEYTPYTLGRARWWVNAGAGPDGPGLPVSDAVLRLLVAIQADGSYVSVGGAIRLGFTKERKIQRLKEALREARWPHHWQCLSSQGASNCYINSEDGYPLRQMLDNKQFPATWIRLLTAAQRRVVLEEVAFWDGCQMSNWTDYQYSSTSKQNVEVLQALATLSGMKTRLRVTPQRGKHSTLYQLSVKDHHHSRGGNLHPQDVPYEGPVYCVTTRTDCVLVRGGASKVPVITKQCANFGYPGGLGAKRFVEYAWKSYNVRLTESEASVLRRQWLAKFPEVQMMFNDVGANTAGGQRFTLKHIFSGRLRGNVGYSDGCNSAFQGLTADGAKLACWAVVKEGWTGYRWDKPIPADAKGLGAETPLRGFIPTAFVHDEIMGESPKGYFRQHAARLSVVMCETMKVFLPDIPVIAEAHAMRRWFKDAEAVHDKDGVLQLWEPPSPQSLVKKIKTKTEEQKARQQQLVDNPSWTQDDVDAASLLEEELTDKTKENWKKTLTDWYNVNTFYRLNALVAQREG